MDLDGVKNTTVGRWTNIFAATAKEKTVNKMRKKFDINRIYSLCENLDCDMLAPPMKAQVALNELCRYFLGDDWYDGSGAVAPEQVNTAIVCEIEKRYKGCRVKKGGGHNATN